MWMGSSSGPRSWRGISSPPKADGPLIRPARLEDRDHIATFTRDTFPWGDYVARIFERWLADPQGITMVAAGPDDLPIGMAHATLLSSAEAWAQGARVHPDFRRMGVGKRLNDSLCTWAAERGARVMRLAVEDWNRAALGQVLQLGYRPVSDWVMAERTVGEAAPGPTEGHLTAEERLTRTPLSEAEPAYLAWAGDELALAAKELVPLGWTWRRLRPADLEEAARRGSLWEGRPGWAIADRERDTLRVSWVTTGQDDAAAMVRALTDRALNEGADRVEVLAPAVSWLTRTMRHGGLDLHPMTVYAKEI